MRVLGFVVVQAVTLAWRQQRSREQLPAAHSALMNAGAQILSVVQAVALSMTIAEEQRTAPCSGPRADEDGCSDFVVVQAVALA